MADTRDTFEEDSKPDDETVPGDIYDHERPPYEVMPRVSVMDHLREVERIAIANGWC